MRWNSSCSMQKRQGQGRSVKASDESVRSRVQRVVGPPDRDCISGQRTTGNARAKGSRRSRQIDEKAVPPERHWPCTRRYGVKPVVARRRQDIPNSPTRISPQGEPENVPRQACARFFRSSHAKTASRWSRDSRADSPKTKLLAQKVKGMGMDKRADHHRDLDENLVLSARNLPNVNVRESRQADPVSLMRLNNMLITQGARR